MKRYVDFNQIEPQHNDVHIRLNNWAAWLRVKSGGGYTQSPIWKKFRSAAWQWHPPEYRESCDILDAQRVEKMVSALPTGPRDTLRWWYVYGGGPGKVAAQMGVSKQTLMVYLQEGRDALAKQAHRPMHAYEDERA